MAEEKETIMPEGFELVETEQLLQLIDLNKNLSRQNVELKTDMATVLACFGSLQGLFGGKISPTAIMKLMNNKESLMQQIAPLAAIIEKYTPVADKQISNG